MKPNAKTLCVFSILSFAFSVLSFIFTAPDAIAFAFAFIGAVLLLYSSVKQTSAKETFFILVTSFSFITLCSKSSPIYPFNDWFDANCFFTVGKSMVHGKILYKDIFEQKGPLLYFFYAFSYKISPTTFFGVYLLEIASSFAFLLLSYKSMLLFCSKKVIFALPVLSAIIYCSPAFSHGGSAEEFSLPVIALVLYIGLKSLSLKSDISKSQWLVIGLCASVVFWTKYTFLGFFIGFLICFFAKSIKKKEVIPFLFSMIWFVCGFALLSVPVLLYFLLNDGLSDLFSVYFYSNILLYSEDSGIFLNLLSGLQSISRKFPAIFGIVAISLFYLFRKKRHSFAFFALTLFFTFFFIFSGGRRFAYYSLLLAVFVPVGVASAYMILKELKFPLPQIKRSSRPLLAFSILGICITTSYFTSPNTYLLKYSKSEMPQFIFDETISKTENPTLLNYGFLDGGFYTASNVIPNCKYFCGLNLNLNEIESTQNSFVDQGLVDFVVTRDTPLPEEISTKYELASTADFKFEKKHFTYYLYKKIDIFPNY